MATLTGQDLVNSVIFNGYPDEDGNGLAILDYINREYRNISGERRWEWLQATNSTLVTAVNASAYALPMADARNLDAVFVTDAAQTQYLVTYKEPIKLLERLQDVPTQNIGAPVYWSEWAGQLLVYPTSDAVYRVTILYTKKITPITLGTSPLLPDEYTDGLVWGAIVPFAHRHHDWLGRDFAIQMRDRAWSLMRADYQLKQRQTSEQVETTGIWSSSSPYRNYGW